MGRKKILEKKLQRLQKKKNNLAQRSKDSTDVAEVHSINEQLEEVNAEIEETQEEIDAINEAQAVAGDATQTIEGGEGEQRTNPPDGALLVNGNVVGSYTQQAIPQTREDPFARLEYREAFKNYVQRGEMSQLIQDGMATMIQRSGDAANTETLGAIIPTTLINQFINETKNVYGQLYNKVRKMNIKGGVRFPVGELSATFKWINEATVSPRQDGGTTDSIMFEYNIGEIRVAQSLLSSIVTLELFEKEVVNIMVKAYLKAMDIGIVKGTGEGQMLGILNDSRITNIIEMTEAEFNNWTAWRKKFFSKLPLGYREGEFIFPLATVESNLATMADSNNNPIFSQATMLEINDKDNVNPNGRFFGHETSLVEPDVITPFDIAEAGDVVGIFWQPEEYAINTNMQMGMKRYFDDETNKYVNKILTVVDGKVLNPKGFYLIKKK